MANLNDTNKTLVHQDMNSEDTPTVATFRTADGTVHNLPDGWSVAELSPRGVCRDYASVLTANQWHEGQYQLLPCNKIFTTGESGSPSKMSWVKYVTAYHVHYNQLWLEMDNGRALIFATEVQDLKLLD